MTHAHPHHAGTEHAHGSHAADLPALLDLDARVLGGYLPAVTAWAAEHADDVRTVLDLGAGTGVGAAALADRFDRARIVAVERAPHMLDRLAAARADLPPGRLEVVAADLDSAWPALGPADLVWVSSALHEVADAPRVLGRVLDALRPGGVVVIVEQAGFPRFLPDDVGSGPHGLEARCHAALAAAGWNAVPDWAPVLAEAGFDAVAQRRFPVEAGPGIPQAEEYARATLRHQRRALAGVLSPEDLATLDRLVADHTPDAVLAHAHLTVRGSRVAWLARRPAVVPVKEPS